MTPLSTQAKMYAPKPPPPPPPPPTDPEIIRKLDEREDRCSDLKEVLKALDEEKGLHPRRVVELIAQNDNVPLGAMLPYLKTARGRVEIRHRADPLVASRRWRGGSSSRPTHGDSIASMARGV